MSDQTLTAMRTSIKTRLLKTLTILVAVTLIVMFALSETGVLWLRRTADDTNTDIGKRAADSSESLLITQALTDTGMYIEAKAANINRQFESIISALCMARDTIEYVYAHAEQYTPKPMQTADWWIDQGAQAGDVTLHYGLCAAKDDVPAVYDEIALLGNTESIYETIQRNNPNISIIYVTTASGINLGYDPYVTMKGGTFYMPLQERGWYKGAVEHHGDVYVFETYRDDFGRGLTITLSVALYNGDQFIGVLGFDILIEEIDNEILATTIGDMGYAMLIGEDGSIISAPDLAEDKTLQDYLGTGAIQFQDGMLSQTSTVIKSRVNDMEVYVFGTRVQSVGWQMAVVLPVDEIIAPAEKSNTAISSIIAQAQTSMNSLTERINIFFIAVAVIVMLAVILIVRRVCVNISSPIIQLTGDVRRIGDGNLEYTANITTGDEIEALSHGFEHMTHSLKDYIENLSRVTADKERIATELGVATQIQASMLPCIFPAFPERPEFDVFATMHPAKEVGGDFYDFFLVDEDHLAVVIADVSGKGVPAALFMVIAKTLIKNHAQNGLSPADVFTNTNRQLTEGNDAGMFVTGWMGIIEISTGRVQFVNAGHNPPLVRHAGGTFEFIKSRAGFVLAGMPGYTYRQNEMTMQPGDTLYLYTDGVTEATDVDNELYGNDRLVAALNQVADQPVTDILPAVSADINTFIRGAAQFDDITMLALRLINPPQQK